MRLVWATDRAFSTLMTLKSPPKAVSDVSKEQKYVTIHSHGVCTCSGANLSGLAGIFLSAHLNPLILCDLLKKCGRLEASKDMRLVYAQLTMSSFTCQAQPSHSTIMVCIVHATSYSEVRANSSIKKRNWRQTAMYCRSGISDREYSE